MAVRAICNCGGLSALARGDQLHGVSLFSVYSMISRCGSQAIKMTLDDDEEHFIGAPVGSPVYQVMTFTSQAKGAVKVEVYDTATDDHVATYESTRYWLTWRDLRMKLVWYDHTHDYRWTPYVCLKPDANVPDCFDCDLRVWYLIEAPKGQTDDPWTHTFTGLEDCLCNDRGPLTIIAQAREDNPGFCYHSGPWNGNDWVNGQTPSITCGASGKDAKYNFNVSIAAKAAFETTGLSLIVSRDSYIGYNKRIVIEDSDRPTCTIFREWALSGEPFEFEVGTVEFGQIDDPGDIYYGEASCDWGTLTITPMIVSATGEILSPPGMANKCKQPDPPDETCSGTGTAQLEEIHLGGDSYFYRWKNFTGGCSGDCNYGDCNPQEPFPLPEVAITQEEAEELLIFGEGDSEHPTVCACVPAYVPPDLPCAADPGDPPIFRLYVTRNGVSGKYIVGWYLHDIGAGCEGSCETNTCTVHPPEEPVVPSGELTAEEVEAEWSELLGVDYIGRCICASTWSPPETECPDCASTSGVTMIIHINMPPFVDEDIELGKTSGQCRWAGYGFMTGADNEFRLTWAAGVWTLVLHDTVNDVQLAQWSGLGRSCDWFGWLTKVSGGSQWPTGVPFKRQV